MTLVTVAQLRASGLAPDVYTGNRVLEAHAWGMQLESAIGMVLYGVSHAR